MVCVVTQVIQQCSGVCYVSQVIQQCSSVCYRDSEVIQQCSGVCYHDSQCQAKRSSCVYVRFCLFVFFFLQLRMVLLFVCLFVCCCCFLFGWFGFDPFSSLLLLDPHENHGAICNQSCSSGRVAFFCGKDYNVGHYTQTVQLRIFISAMLIGIVDLYRSILSSLTLTFGGDHKLSTKQNLLVSFAPTLCNSSG